MTEEFSTQSPQLMSERVRTLTALAHNKKGLFIVPLNGLKSGSRHLNYGKIIKLRLE